MDIRKKSFNTKSHELRSCFSTSSGVQNNKFGIELYKFREIDFCNTVIFQ